jgi:Protein of unknown function (DUF2934)
MPHRRKKMVKSLVYRPRHGKSRSVPPNIAIDANIETPEEQPAQSAEFIERDEHDVLVRERAYYLAEQRGFESGHEVDDWLAAEREVERAWASPTGEGATLCGD